jgi:hypothetical protein
VPEAAGSEQQGADGDQAAEAGERRATRCSGSPPRPRPAVLHILPSDQGQQVRSPDRQQPQPLPSRAPSAAKASFTSSSTTASRACGSSHFPTRMILKVASVLAADHRKSAGPQEPADDGVSVPRDDEPVSAGEPEVASSAHTEIQYLLAKLGADTGFDVHITPKRPELPVERAAAERHAAPLGQPPSAVRPGD